MFGMTYLYARSLASENQGFPKMVGILRILRLLTAAAAADGGDSYHLL